MREILQGIFVWSWLSPPHGYHFNGHLFRLPGLTFCVDPVTAEPSVLEAICAARPERTVLTNRNHTRISGLLRERLGTRIAIHPKDAPHARAQGVSIDEELQPGMHIGPLTVVAVPGKSPGEIALYDPERRLLLVGDALIGDPPGQVRLLRPQVIDDLQELQSSIRQLLHLDFDTLLCGDGEPILTGARAAVEKLVATFT
jgi:glyoxylase-like metal-dependent hydrolase (beta-lactamase superfamily II)